MGTPQSTPQPKQETGLTLVQRKFQNIQTYFSRPAVMQQISAALPKFIDEDRFVRIALTELRRTPDLLDCDPLSIVGSVLQAAQLGLEVDRVLGQAYLIKYGKECQMQPGYRGYIQLSRRSGEIKSLYAQVVHQGEAFEYEQGTDKYLRHRPDDDCEDGDITHVYAVVEYTNGGKDFEVMSRKAVEKVRAKSKAPNSPAWTQSYDEMCKAKVLRRLSKRLPLSAENASLVRAAVLDESVDAGVSQNNAALVPDEYREHPTQFSTQDFNAGAASQNKVSNLSELHAQPKKEGSVVASDPSPAPVTTSSPRTPSPEPQNQEEMDQAWDQLGESQPTTKPSAAKEPEVQGVQLGFGDTKYGDG